MIAAMEKNRGTLKTVLGWFLIVWVVVYIPISWLPVQAIIGEAADQGFIAMIGVGEVIRVREDFDGFTALKKDFVSFSRKESFWTRRKAEAAWFISRFTNFTHRATHFENVRRFGPPPWIHEMKKTTKLSDLVFFKKKS